MRARDGARAPEAVGVGMERRSVTEADPETGAGRLEAIWIKRERRGPMDPVDRAEAIEDHGLAGNVEQARRRQVTILSAEAWATMMEELDAELDPAARRANLMVSGLELAETVGRVLAVGDVRIRVEGETRPCGRMDEALSGLRAAMEPGWRGGVFGVVLSGGTLRVGDPAGWER